MPAHGRPQIVVEHGMARVARCLTLTDARMRARGKEF